MPISIRKIFTGTTAVAALTAGVTLLSTSPAAGSPAALDRNSGVSSRPATNAAARSMWLNMVNFSFAHAEDQSTSQSTVATTTRYGAIAYSPSTLAWGTGLSTETSSIAESRALAYCQQNTTAGDCRVVDSGFNGWGALAVSWANGPAGWGWASTRAQAEINARYYCMVYGGGNACGIQATVDATPLP